MSLYFNCMHGWLAFCILTYSYIALHCSVTIHLTNLSIAIVNEHTYAYYVTAKYVATAPACAATGIILILSVDASISSNSGSSSDSVAIIGGAVGGVILLLMTIVVLCIVILCMRRSHRRKGVEDDKVTYSTSKLNTDVTMDHNPSYDVTMDHNPSYDVTMDHNPSYDVTMDHNPSYDVTMDHNPSYDITKANTVDYSYDDTINPGGSDIPITTNPSYNVHTKPYSKTGEDEYNYVLPNELTQQSDVDGYVKIYPYTGQSHGIRGIHSHFTVNSTKQYEYGVGVVNQP